MIHPNSAVMLNSEYDSAKYDIFCPNYPFSFPDGPEMFVVYYLHFLSS